MLSRCASGYFLVRMEQRLVTSDLYQGCLEGVQLQAQKSPPAGQQKVAASFKERTGKRQRKDRYGQPIGVVAG
jgi:hypothetical protein